MKFRYLLILFLLLLVSESGICQVKEKDPDADLMGKVQATPSNLEFAKFEINDIKRRGIIIRLKTNKDRIAAYKKAGNTKVAMKMEQEAKETNLQLMDAFISHWTYCPVYFMESQNTNTLLLHDSLIAKSYDLKKDTVIYMNHDSAYFIDYGVLMANEPPSDNTNFKDLNKTEESNNPISEGCLVVKDGRSNQLQHPFPYFTKVSFMNIGKAGSSVNGENISFSPTTAATLVRLYSLDGKTKEQKDSLSRIQTQSFDYIIKYHSKSVYQNSVIRLNNKFIAYYCTRLDKDKDILCNNDPYYWWQRNPNIRYIVSLPKLEKELKVNSYEEPKFTK